MWHARSIYCSWRETGPTCLWISTARPAQSLHDKLKLSCNCLLLMWNHCTVVGMLCWKWEEVKTCLVFFFFWEWREEQLPESSDIPHLEEKGNRRMQLNVAQDQDWKLKVEAERTLWTVVNSQFSCWKAWFVFCELNIDMGVYIY